MYAPTLEVQATPGPSVQVLFEDLDPDCVELTVWRSTANADSVVRGADRQPAVGGFVVTDTDAPVGVPVTYRGEQFDSDGIRIGFTDAAEVSLPSRKAMAWVSDPLDPATAVEVELEGSFLNEINRPRPTAVYQAGGRTVALMGQRQLRRNIPLSMTTETRDEAEALDAVLGRGVVLIRTGPEAPIPRLLYVVIPEVPFVPYASWLEKAVWPLVGHEVSGTTVQVAVPLYTWADVKAAYATWDLVKADYLTWLDLKSRPPEV